MNYLVIFWEYVKYFSKIIYKLLTPVFEGVALLVRKYPIISIVTVILFLYYLSASKDPNYTSETVNPNSEYFSGWNGSNPQFVDYIKDRMNDPSSFEHVETRYNDDGSNLKLYMKYRGKNGFGAILTKEAICTFNKYSKTISEVRD